MVIGIFLMDCVHNVNTRHINLISRNQHGHACEDDQWSFSRLISMAAGLICIVKDDVTLDYSIDESDI